MRSICALLLAVAATTGAAHADGVFAFDAPFSVLPATATPSSHSIATSKSDGSTALWTSAKAPAVDRVFEYGRHFKLDEPFTIRLSKGETVLLPLEPLRQLLFPETAALLTSDEKGQHESTAAAQPLSIGLELSNCEGSLQSFVVLQNNHARSFSTASYQCVTITEASEAQQQQVNLCPQYDPDFPVAMRADPTQVKGFILRADVESSVESIALLRSTKATGGFEKTFVVTSADDRPQQAPFNVTFSYAETTLSFEAPAVWDHAASNASSITGKNTVCEACEYFLYAEKIAPNHTALSSTGERAVLPYCMRERSSVQYQLPTPSSDTTGSALHRHVKVDDLFADQFRASGEYRFVLLASLPSALNHHHPAILAYAPQQLVVTGKDAAVWCGASCGWIDQHSVI